MKRIRHLNKSLQLINLTEARRNPDQNPKISAYEALKPYKDNPDMFISFTKIDKLGINPKSDFDTPLGIYCYPLKEIWKKYSIDQKQSVGQSVPYAGKSPYVWLIRKKSSINFIDDLSTDYKFKDYEQDLQILKNDILDNEKDYEELYKKFHYKNLEFHIKDLFLKWAKEANQSSAAGKIWNTTRNLAKFRNSSRSKPIVQWNAILRDVLGYDGVADKSSRGIIHPSELLQAVFFHKRAFEVVGEFLNKDYEITNLPEWTKEAKTKDFTFKIIKDTYIKNKNLVFGFGGTWLDGTWESGIWQDGTWLNGIWKGRAWINGIWKNGTWMYGLWKKGTWENGIWKKGTWKNGTWLDGTLEMGIWENGIWKNGTWEMGRWENGIWIDGIWKMGIWKAGTWKKGWILDHDKIGNFLPDWEWNGKYVKSLINPKDYFDKNYKGR